jgi:hypothetical protein
MMLEKMAGKQWRGKFGEKKKGGEIFGGEKGGENLLRPSATTHARGKTHLFFADFKSIAIPLSNS